jgi:acyl-CoA thioesterase-1
MIAFRHIALRSAPPAAWLILFLLSVWSLAIAPAAENGRRTVLVLGDSIAAGFGLEADQAFPRVLQRKIDAARLSADVINAGVSGDTSAGGLRRIDWQLKRPCDVLILELGGNDGLRGLSVTDLQQNLQAIIDRAQAKYPRIEILVAGMQMPPNLGPDYARSFQQAFVTVAQKNHATLIPFLLEGVGGVPELNLPDRIHPTPEGHKIVAENVWKVLEPVLRKMDSRSPASSAQRLASSAATNAPAANGIQR